MREDRSARYASPVGIKAGIRERLHELGAALREEFQCDRVTVFVKAPRGVYVSVYAEGLKGMNLAVKPGEGIVGKAIERRVPVISNEALHDPEALSRLRDHYSGYATHSLLVAPIPGLLGIPIGAVQLVNKLNGCFTKDDARQLTAAAKGLRGLRRLFRSPVENIWECGLHRKSQSASTPTA